MECAPLASCSSEDSVVPFSSPCATPDMSKKKKRNRNPLLPNSRDKKVMELSQIKQYYLKNKAISESVSKSLCFIQKSCNAAAASWAMPSSSNKNLSSHSNDDESTGFDYYNRRLAIQHVFKTIYQQAEPELWHEKQVVSGIMDRLGIK